MVFRLRRQDSPPPPSPQHQASQAAPPPSVVVAPLPIMPSLLHRTVGGHDEHEVVGESYRQDGFEQTVGPRTENGPSIEHVTVQLVRERTNQHDPDAVAVFIGRSHVGYIPADDAAEWHPVIDELHRANLLAICVGQVRGGWWKGPGDNGSYGLVVHASSPPRRLLASDASITGDGWIDVQGEENCQDVLFVLAEGKSERRFVVSLASDADGRLRASHGDQELGRMTPKMSARYAPIVSRLQAAGWPTTCEARVKLGKTKLEVKLQMPTNNYLKAVLSGLGL